MGDLNEKVFLKRERMYRKMEMEMLSKDGSFRSEYEKMNQLIEMEMEMEKERKDNKDRRDSVFAEKDKETEKGKKIIEEEVKEEYQTFSQDESGLFQINDNNIIVEKEEKKEPYPCPYRVNVEKSSTDVLDMDFNLNPGLKINKSNIH